VTPRDLAAEFDLAVANLNADHFRHLAGAGVSFEAICRAGYVAIERIATTGRLYMPSADGFPAVILAAWSPTPPSIYTAVESPEILDLLALRLNQPETWWRRVGELGLVLGEDRYLEATQTGAPLKVFDSPLAWLRSGCQGSVFLDDVEGRRRWDGDYHHRERRPGCLPGDDDQEQAAPRE